MSSLDRERRYEDTTSMLAFVLEQEKKDLYTCMPGIVESYNASTKRANVRGAIKLRLTSGELMMRKPIVNVPVVFPSGGGFTLHLPVRAGDSVLLCFSMRGLTEFKRSFADSNPEPRRMLAEADAVALPGFGALSFTPAVANGATLQTESGNEFIAIEESGIRIQTSGTVNIDGDVNITGSLTASGDVEDGTSSMSDMRSTYNAHNHELLPNRPRPTPQM